VVVSGALGVAVFAITPRVAWPYLAGFLLLGAGYSAPPVRFKTTPFLDSVSNGLYILPGAAAYAAVSGTHPPIAALAGAWLWAMGMHTFSAIPDIEPDRAAGIGTTATLLGEGRTYAYCVACWVAAAVAFAAVDIRLGVLLGVYPVFAAWVARSSIAVDRAYWWFPALNTAVGTLLAMGGLWRVYPSRRPSRERPRRIRRNVGTTRRARARLPDTRREAERLLDRIVRENRFTIAVLFPSSVRSHSSAARRVGARAARV